MSALLAPAKVLHALASGFQHQAERDREEGDGDLARYFDGLSRVCTFSADMLGEQMKAECSGEDKRGG